MVKTTERKISRAEIDNEPIYHRPSFVSFSAVKQIQTPEWGSCPPGLAPCDLFLYLDWKSLQKKILFSVNR